MRQFLVTLDAMLACAIVCLILSHTRVILIETRQHMDQIKIILFGQWCNNIEECGRAGFGYFIVENEHFIWHYIIISCIILFAFILFLLNIILNFAIISGTRCQYDNNYDDISGNDWAYIGSTELPLWWSGSILSVQFWSSLSHIDVYHCIKVVIVVSNMFFRVWGKVRALHGRRFES